MIRKYLILVAALLVSYLLLDMVGKTLKGFIPQQQPVDRTSQLNESNESISTQAIAPEISQIKTTTNLDEQVKLYKALIERVGPEQAQGELQKSGLPFDGQTHLLNHTVGDWLYEKHGTGGLIHCKDYFLSSCYHGFVIHAVALDGIEVLKNVMAKCWESGEHVSVQCSHAIGHGFLAYDGYANLTKALKDCDEMVVRSERFPLYNCHDGVFMENIWAVHETGKPSKDRWVKDSDPIYPCNDSRIESKYINACWSNQPMRLYQLFQGDLARVGGVCLGVADATFQRTCFDGLARQIHPLTKGSVDEAYRMCSLMSPAWVDPCIISITRAAFSVGDKEIPFTMCERIREESKKSCYEALSNIIVSYTMKDLKERQMLCAKIPSQFNQTCK